MSSVSADRGPFGVFACVQPSVKRLSFIGPDRESVDKVKTRLYTGQGLEGKWKIYAAKTRKPGDWTVEFGTNSNIENYVKLLVKGK